MLMLFKHICERHMEVSFDLLPADGVILQQKHQSYTGGQGFVRNFKCLLRFLLK